MSGYTEFRNLVAKALPDDLTLEDLCDFREQTWSPKSGQLEESLRNNPRLNWRAYIENNPDVKVAAIDPAFHFLNYGIYEGRKLYSWHPAYVLQESDRVDLSIIIYGDKTDRQTLKSVLNNNGSITIELILLAKEGCLGSEPFPVAPVKNSIITQTVICPTNLSSLACMKSAVSQAHGEYLMFLEHGETFLSGACQIAWESIIRGADACFFCKDYRLARASLSPWQEKRLSTLRNMHKAGLYNQHQILRMLFCDQILDWRLSGKIFLRQMAVKAFENMQCHPAQAIDPVYEMLVLVDSARTLQVSSEQICISPFITNLDFSTEARKETVPANLLAKIEDFCAIRGLQRYGQSISEQIFAEFAFGRKSNTTADASRLHDAVACYSPLFATLRLYSSKYSDREEVLRLFSKVEDMRDDLETKNIGVLCLNAGGLLAQRQLAEFCGYLVGSGYHVNLFLQEHVRPELELPPGVRVWHLTPQSARYSDNCQHLRDINDFVSKSHISSMLYYGSDNPKLMWITLLLNLMRIKTVAILLEDIRGAFINRQSAYPHSEWLETLKCADNIICPTVAMRTYLGANGINANFLPFPAVSPHRKCASPGHKILVFGNVHNPFNNINDSLRVLQVVLKNYPDAIMQIIGDFDAYHGLGNFFTRATRLNVRSNIEIIGAVPNPEPYFQNATLMLSTACAGGWTNGMAAAQSAGLPLIAYQQNLPLPEIEENVIMVSQGDYQAAAREIIRIFDDENLLRHLAGNALSKAARNSVQKFSANLEEILTGSERQGGGQIDFIHNARLLIRDLASCAGTATRA